MRRVKESVNFALSYFLPAENLAGVGVNTMLILASRQFLSKHDCAEAGLANDVPKLLFMGLFALRLLAIPLLSKGMNYFYPLKEITQQKLFLLETESLAAIKTVVFVLTVLRSYGGGTAWAVLLGLLSTWPLEAQAYRLNNPKFARGAYDEDNHSSPSVALYFALRESLYGALALSSAIAVILSFAFNVFWDSDHEHSYPAQNTISILSLIIFGFLGMSSVLGKTVWNTLRAAELSANTFFYTFMFCVSLLQCVQPSLFSVAGFEQTGWYVSLIIGILSLLPTAGSFAKGLSNPYEKSENQSSLPFWNCRQSEKTDDEQQTFLLSNENEVSINNNG